MTRNESALDFQKRLIQTALKSPREESVKMLGIVYSNLKEFVQVRIPLDKHPDEIIDKFFEVLELFDAALQKKHSMAYISNDPMYILESVQTSNIVFGRAIIESSKDDENAKLAVYTFLDWYYNSKHENIVPGGCFIDGNYFRHSAILRMLEYAFEVVGEPENENEQIMKAFEKYSTDVLTTHYNLTGSRTKISAPEHGPVSDNQAVHMIQKWLDSVSPVHVRIAFEQNPEAEQQFVFRKMHSPDGSYNYKVVYRNDLFLDYDLHAKNILDYLKRTHDISITKTLKYKELDDDSIFGYRIGRTAHDPYDTVSDGRYIHDYMRGPFDIPMVLTEICATLNMMDALYMICNVNSREDLITTMDEYRMHRIMKPEQPYLEECFLTVYRTGHNYTDVNRKFILLMAILLERKCHVYIEARARGDEQSNIDLYRELLAIGADVHVVSSHYPDFKVHAKAWTFISKYPGAPDRVYLSVYSTGNFVDSAQRGFADSVCFERGYVGELDDIPGVRLWKDLMDDSGERKWRANSEKLVWEPNQIRKTIMNLIHRQMIMIDRNFYMTPEFHTLHEYRPFIWIKVNHITDTKMIKALSKAASKGVDVRILARTTCTIPSRTSAIQIRSIAGKYLEHDRFFIFGLIRRSPEEFPDIISQDAYISSCDLMERNLNKRIEFLYKIDKDDHFLADLYLRMWNRETDPKAGYFRYSI